MNKHSDYEYITIMDAFKPEVVKLKVKDKSLEELKTEIIAGIFSIMEKHIGEKPHFDDWILEIANNRLMSEFLETDNPLIMMPFIPISSKGEAQSFNFRIKRSN